jgi:hypothetical protein
MIKFAEPEQHDVFAEKGDLQEPSQEPESNIDANSQSSTSSVFSSIFPSSRLEKRNVRVYYFFRYATGYGEISPLPETRCRSATGTPPIQQWTCPSTSEKVRLLF